MHISIPQYKPFPPTNNNEAKPIMTIKKGYNTQFRSLFYIHLTLQLHTDLNS